MDITVIAEYHDQPAEGINVVSKTLIDDLRQAGHMVRVIDPGKVLHKLPMMLRAPSDMTVFTHGPGQRTVLATRILRALSRTKLVWVATRPDIQHCPGWLKGGRSAHFILCNRPRDDLRAVAKDAHMIEQPIGIAPERMVSSGSDGPDSLWPELRARDVPIATHVGHLRSTRGLDRLLEIKALLGDRIEIVMQASPYFEPDPGLVGPLQAANIHIRRDFVAHIADVYHSSDLYLFPTPPEHEGAIELPLSVLEALSCKIPVVSTPFGALPGALAGVEGVHFAPAAQFAQTVSDLIDAGLAPKPTGLPAHLNAHHLAQVVSTLLSKT